MDLDRFSVATLNLYNLQLPGKAMNPGQSPWTHTEYRRKVVWTGNQLRDLGADIVGLEELWHAQAIADVLR
ncbi:MAG: endonuclease/exonuclease/phosphatase family protein, partial [Nocardioides sp.]